MTEKFSGILATPLFEFTAVEKVYQQGERKWILGPLSFQVQKGEQIALIGPSGAGKSTLLHLAGGLDRSSGGEIFFQGKAFSEMSKTEMDRYRNRAIGFIFQDFYLLPEFSLLENVAMPLKIAGVAGKKAQQKALKALSEVGLSGKAQALPRELSGGERQRGAIARAIVHSPPLLLADEPTGNLDDQTAATVIELLAKLQRNHQLTLLIATHDKNIASRQERRIFLENGRLVRDTKTSRKK